ncbi:MAG TPA: DUF6600 domain-containing protein [Candidatus Baltobacteraceae bacterium]|nr:DUF6600 domain-containing protein [Candidatus Baltobacteraceae bacterium]
MRSRLGAVNARNTFVAPLFLALLLAIAGLSVFPGAALAQDDDAQADPPGRVARLGYLQGSVSFQPAGTQDWIDANPNRPLTTGDNLWADQDSRGELHIGSSVVRLSGQTGVSFLNLTDQVTQLQLAQGSIYVRVRELADGEAFEVDTPNLAFTVVRPGQYRVNVDPNGGATMIEVFGGAGNVVGGGQAYNLNPGQEFSFTGTDQLAYDAQPLPGRDDFDSWCLSRDQREDRSASARYVSRDVIGYDDLDDYGAWSNDPEYGNVWIPNGVAADWAPYHYGHWVFVAPWGWTWVEDEPWGFAPFHYGRWAVIGGRWGWVPGPVAVGVVVGGPVIRPMYAPALVGFVGGGGFSLSIAIGGGAGVAWFPLGPRDVWVPAYRCSPVYVQHVNVYNTRVVNVTQVTTVYNNVYVNHNTTVVNHYTYASNVRAVTAVDRDTFVNGRPVGRASVRISQTDIQNPRVMDRGAIQPTQRSAFGGQANAKVAPPASLANRRVVTKLTPASNAVPIGHTQPLARGGNNAGFRPNGGQPNNQPGNRPGNENNNARPGFQQFHPPNSNNGNPNAGGTNGNANTGGANAARPNNQNNNEQPGNSNDNARPGYRPFTPPSGNSNPNANENRNPNNNPSFNRNQPPNNEQRSNENGNANRSNNTDNSSRGGFKPPAQGNESNSQGNKNKENKEQKESKPPKDDDKDHKDH